METEYLTLAALMSEVEARREAGDEILEATDAKTRVVGFYAGDDYLYIKMSRLSTEQLQSVPGFIEQTPADLEGLWNDGLMNDVMEKADELTQGEREAEIVNSTLPSTEQMASYVTLIEQGLREAGFDWKIRTYPASPFTFSWGTPQYTKHDPVIELRTDHAGVSISVVYKHGVERSDFLYAQRIAWEDATEERGWPLPAWVKLYAERAMGYYKVAPECDCPHHQDMRAGRMLSDADL